MHYLLIPSIILYALYTIFFKMPSFSFLLFLLITLNIQGDDQKDGLTEKFKQGLATIEEKSLLAKDHLDRREYEKAKHIYRDIIDNTKADISHLFNYATSLLYTGEVASALNIYSQIEKQSSDQSIKEKIQNNIAHFLMQKKKKQKKNNKDKQQKEGQKKQEQSKKDENKEKDSKKQEQKKKTEDKPEQKKDQKQQAASNEQNKTQKNKKKEQEENAQQDNKKKDEQQQKKGQTAPKSVEERERNIQQRRKLTKVPTLLKKLMQDDRGLQKKYIDTRTQNKQYVRDKKDW